MPHSHTHVAHLRHHHHQLFYHNHPPQRLIYHKQKIGVCSESGKLNAVIMHRPGRELERLTPENKDALLFDNIPNINETHASHDEFAAVLRKQGVQVFYVLDLLRETLEYSPEARTMLIDGIVAHRGPLQGGPAASVALSRFLHSTTPSQLAHTAVEGLACNEEELGSGDDALVLLQTCRTNEFLVPPLPNLLFTRDPFTIIEKCVFIWHMAKPARYNEPLIMRVIFSFPAPHAHLSLNGLRVIDWESHADSTATVEGGDVAYLGHGILLIGCGERTNHAGIEAIERTGLFRQVIVVELPENRDYMHLDTVLSSIGRSAFTLHHHLAEKLPVYTVQTIEEEDGYDDATEWLYHGHDVRRALRHLLHNPHIIFYDAIDEATSIMEQRQCRDNVLSVSDRIVLTYAGGHPTDGIVSQMVKDSRHPCRVHTFPPEGLIEGCGGAHCMTNALSRNFK